MTEGRKENFAMGVSGPSAGEVFLEDKNDIKYK